MNENEQKAINIDKPVNDVLRQWKLLTPEGKESDAAIRALLSHTAGIMDVKNGFYGLHRSNPAISMMDILVSQGRGENGHRLRVCL